jgi:hypothetical protein
MIKLRQLKNALERLRKIAFDLDKKITPVWPDSVDRGRTLHRITYALRNFYDAAYDGIGSEIYDGGYKAATEAKTKLTWIYVENLRRLEGEVF